MAEENKALVKSSIALTRFDPKASKELVVRGLIALAEARDADFYFFKGEEHRTKGELRQAVDNYEQALRIDPKHVDSLFWMGYCYAVDNKPQYNRAAEALQDAINIREKAGNLSRYDCVMYHNLGFAQSYLGFDEKEIERYKQRIEREPEYAASHYLPILARYYLYLHEKEIERYIERYEETPVREPEYAASYYLFGLAQHYLGLLYEEALERYKQARELYPEFGGNHELFCLGRKKRDLEHLVLGNFEKYLSIDGNKSPRWVEYAESRVEQLKVGLPDRITSPSEVCPNCARKYGLIRYLHEILRHKGGWAFYCSGVSDQEHPCSWPFKSQKGIGGIGAIAIREREYNIDYTLLKILSMQKAAGGFEMDEPLARILKLPVSDWQQLTKEMTTQDTTDRFVLLSTALVLSLLKVYFMDKKNDWHTTHVRKSEKWLTTEAERTKPMVNGMELTDWADKYLKSLNLKV